MFFQDIEPLRKVILLFLFISIVFLPPLCPAGVISPDLQSVLRSSVPSEEISVIITLSDRVDLTPIKDEKDKHLRRAKIVKELKDKADTTQGSLKDFIQSQGPKRMVPLWIINGIAVTVPAGTVREIANFPGVESVTLDYVVQVPPVTVAAAAAPEWNINAIKAPELWNIGFTGTGIVVANMDTGVDIFHPDLSSMWRGGTNSWYNPYSDPANAANCATSPCSICETDSTTPCDIFGHGTGTMGIMAGGSAGGTVIGVAPDAKWIAVKVLNDAGSGPLSIILQGFQWIIGLPSGQAPDVVNNSFGEDNNPGGCDLTFQASIQILKTAGISVVFAAGNDGPFPATSISPANNVGSFAVGATDINNTIASRSSRGPSPPVAGCGNGSIFPQVVAPGVNVRTATTSHGGLPNSYLILSGTSLSSPHVAGAMALVSEAFPTLSPSQIETILEQTALGLVDVPPNNVVPNNSYGYGLVDTANAYENAFNIIHGSIPEIASMPPSFDFGNVQIPAAVSNTFTIVNRGIANLGITNITVTGPDSAEFVKQSAGDTCPGQTLLPLASCTVTVLFSPTSVGPKSASLSIQSTDPAQPLLDLPLSASVFALIPGKTVSSPAITWNETAQKIHIAVRGANGSSIWAGSISSSGIFDNDWTQIPGGTSDAPAIAWNETAQKLHIAVRGANGSSLWLGSINSGGTFNNDWTQIPGAIAAAPAIAWDGTAQKLHIAVREANGSIWTGSANSSGIFNNDWTQIPGATSDALAIAWNTTAQKLHIAVRGTNGSSIWVGSTNSSGVFNNDWNPDTRGDIGCTLSGVGFDGSKAPYYCQGSKWPQYLGRIDQFKRRIQQRLDPIIGRDVTLRAIGSLQFARQQATRSPQECR